MTSPIVLLVVEDDPDHVELLRRALASHRCPFEIVWMDTVRAAQQWLAQNTPDLLLTDLYLPDGSGKVFLQNNENLLPYPVIIQTAHGDEQKAVEMIKAGAFDYLPKRFDLFRELPYVLEHAVEEWRHQRERQEMEARLQAGQSIFQAIFENAPVGLLYFDEKGVVQAVNPQLAHLVGMPSEALLGLELLNVPYEPIASAVQRALEGEKISQQVDFRIQPYQRGLAIRSHLSPVQLPDGRVIGGVAILEDITAEKNDQDLQQALFEIASLANQARTAESLYAGIHQIVRKVLPAENFYIALWDRKTRRLSFPYWVDQYDPNPGVVPLAKGLTEYVLRSGRTLLAENELCEEMEKRGEIDRLGTPSEAWLGAPLKDRAGRVFGAVVIQSYDPQVRYNLHQVNVMEYIAIQIGQVLQRFQTEEKERYQRKLAEAILDATTVLTQSLDVEQVFQRILHHLYNLIRYDNCRITLIEGEWVQVVAEKGIPLPQTEETQKMRWRDFATFSQIYNSGSPLLIPNVQEYPKWVRFRGLEWIRTYLGLPLTVKGRVIGFLNLAFRNILDMDLAHARPLMAFANLAGQAIENARLYQQAQELAIHDELTGIYNRRGLNILAQREFERSVRYQRPLSALFSDIDAFKAFNDRYSYAVGDQVLKGVAGCLKSNLREFDVLARFGGDEFVAVLPEAQEKEAVSIVHRLNHAIQTLRVPYNEGEVSVSLSFGVTQRVESDRSWDELLDRASEALRRAKQAGIPFAVA
ncbi:MAG: diguanylate cyclase [Anaerolineales bacterium]|nr:diguanylate cyclase [Anaerolineales bacterium]